jgi:Flp pilus assembly protein TadD
MAKKLFASLAIAAAVSVASLPAMNQAMAFQQSKAAENPNKTKRKTQLVGPTVGKKVGRAFEAYSADDIDGAITILLDIKTSKSYDRAYLDRFIANMYATKGGDANIKQAVKYLKSSIEPDVLNYKEHADSIKLLADLEMQEKAYADALKHYKQWMDFTLEEDANTYVKIAQANYELKTLDKMIAPADKAIALYNKEGKPNQNPYILKLTSYYERKQYKNAVDVLETVIQIFPENKQWWTQLGMFYMLVEDYTKALATLDMAYKQGFLEKESEIKTLANLYATNNVPYKSGKLLEKYIDNGLIPRDEKSIATMANAFHAAQEIKAAAKYFGEAAKLSNDPKHYRKQGVLLQQAEQYKAAIGPLKKAIELGISNEGRVYMTIAESYFYQEDYKQAYVYIKKAMEDPKSKKAARSWASYIKDTAERKKVKI